MNVRHQPPRATGLPKEGQSRAGDSDVSSLSWDDLRIVKALSDSGNRATAADRLGLNASTLSRRIAHLEQALGVTIFTRRRSGYTLTAEGQELRALSERVELDIVSVARRVGRATQEPIGNLRITTSDSLLLHFLTPIIAAFRRRHTAIRIEVYVGNDALNLARDESDIALRATKNPLDTLAGRRLATIAWAAYGRRADFPHNTPAGDRLYEQLWVSYAGRLAGLGAVPYVDARVAASDILYRADSVAAISSAISAGMGIGFLPCMLGDVMPGLMRMGPVVPELDDELWLLTHPDIRISPRVQTFMQFCADAVREQKALIEGRSPATPV
ncbi:LysR family transcriptional regulator [Bordetella genomosp. 5]|uniref:LysR family transcriptional regulator n=1 Tax=Bordetella genomosp. 5 TaxID=1395608 RepID=A0A261TSJ4_9BORD|nr:LysR family transcriptional regulator [Bordetella genomosp. 5]